jgi:acyl-CoA synthetase (AMP-forming)/AMP-acid ligase II
MTDIINNLRDPGTGQLRKFGKNELPNLSSVRIILVAYGLPNVRIHGILHQEFYETMVQLRMTMRCILTPLCSLTEHGGIIISSRYGMDVAPRTIHIDPAQLRQNKVCLVSEATNKEMKSIVSLFDFGLVLPETGLAIVDPTSQIVLQEDCHVGEIWVQAPSYTPIGFHQKLETTTFVFQAIINYCDGTNTMPLPAHGYFLRTGILGFIHQNRLFVVGCLGERMEYMDYQKRTLTYYTPDISCSIQKYFKDIKAR